MESLGDGVWRVRVRIDNARLTPTILALAERHRAVRPDLVLLTGVGTSVVAAGWVRDRFQAGTTDLIDQKDLSRILVRNGHPGRTTRVLEYLVRGGTSVTVTYDSAKGGKPSITIPLKPTPPPAAPAAPAR